MTRRPRRQTPDSRQADLMDWVGTVQPKAPTPGALNIDVQLRGWLAQALKDCGKDREIVAAEMRVLLGASDDGEDEAKVSRAMLDAWTAQSRGAWRFPLSYLPVFIQVTGATWLLDEIARPVGCKVLEGEEVRYAAMARLDNEIARMQAMKRDLESRLPRRARR
jgi:hypothetical protein